MKKIVLSLSLLLLLFPLASEGLYGFFGIPINSSFEVTNKILYDNGFYPSELDPDKDTTMIIYSTDTAQFMHNEVISAAGYYSDNLLKTLSFSLFFPSFNDDLNILLLDFLRKYSSLEEINTYTEGKSVFKKFKDKTSGVYLTLILNAISPDGIIVIFQLSDVDF